MEDLTKKEKQILELYDKILDYVSNICKDHPEYSAQDAYIAVAYLKYQMSKCLGPKTVKAIEASFIIDPGDVKGFA